MAFISDDIAQKMLAKVHRAVNENEGQKIALLSKKHKGKVTTKRKKKFACLNIPILFLLVLSDAFKSVNNKKNCRNMKPKVFFYCFFLFCFV